MQSPFTPNEERAAQAPPYIQHAWQRLWDRLLAEPCEPHVQSNELKEMAATNEAAAGDDVLASELGTQIVSTSRLPVKPIDVASENPHAIE